MLSNRDLAVLLLRRHRRTPGVSLIELKDSARWAHTLRIIDPSCVMILVDIVC